ncbi:MAG: cell division protein ZapA [Gammaproteobacteria bacterium]|nr:cell division protein ZapA [Gammaproteobacteria bacterium]
MNANNVPIVVHILDKEYRISCEKGEEEGLLASARLLDGKMRGIRSSGKVIGTDRMAVLAALNLAHELLQGRNDSLETAAGLQKRLRVMHDKIDVALNQSNQLEV